MSARSRVPVAGCAVAVLALVLAAACGSSEQQLKVEVTGTEGTAVRGVCTYRAQGSPMQETIDRTVPFEIEAVGSKLSCYLQKTAQDGTVHLQLYVNGQPVAFQTTRAAYGSVTATTP